MITRTLLRNWRGYEKLSLDFGPGLTFVIADNGVGKTSLVNGVAWALFGDESGVDADAAIRAGTDETTAEVELQLGEATVSLVRILRRTAPRGRSRLSLTVSVDGVGADADTLRRLFSDAANVPLEIVPQLMFVPEMRLTHEGELFADVQEHLAALLGIDDLRRAARTLRQAHHDATAELRDVQEVVKLDADTVGRLAAMAEELRGEIALLDAALTADGARRRELEASLQVARAWDDHDQAVARHQARWDELADELRSVDIEPDPEAATDAARRAGDAARELHADLVAAETESTLVEGLVAQLAEADAVCPVCLQALDEPTAEHAAAEHRARLAELAARRGETERRRHAVDAAADKLRTIATELGRQRPPEPPESSRPDVTSSDLQVQLTELDEARAERLDRRGALGERLAQAVQALEDSEAAGGDTAGALAQGHAVAASSSWLARLADAEADARTERALQPISSAITTRWAEFFGTRSSRPRLAGGGSIELGHAGGTIPYASFSGGEKTLASLLTRLLFVTSATGLRSMWLDEPLEHLDPANRTRVARLLAQVSQPGRHMHQLVVTTYEEGLARSMVGRHEATEVVYVSTDDLL